MIITEELVRRVLESNPRLEALKRTGLLDSLPEHAFDQVTRLATVLLKAPVAWIALVDDHRQFFKSHEGLDEPWASARETPLSHSICQYVVASAETLVIEDSQTHELVAGNRAVEELKVRSYAGAPLITADGLTLGALCVTDCEPRCFSEHEVELLVTLAASIAAEINLRLVNAALTQSEARAQGIFERAPLGILMVREDGVVVSANPRACALAGYPEAELVGLNVVDLTHPYDAADDRGDESNASRLRRIWNREAPFLEWESRFLRKDGSGDKEKDWFWARWHAALVHDPIGSDFAILMFEDITAQREANLQLARQAAQLEALSLTDPLTGLANRRGFISVGEQMLKGAIRRGQTSVVLFFDLDGLKKANDQLGHDVGDQMIEEFAGLLKGTFREADLMARWGGDEFVVLATDILPDKVGSILTRLDHARDELQATKQLPFRLSASAGWAASPVPAPIGVPPVKLEELIRQADAMMYEDKRRHYARS